MPASFIRRALVTLVGCFALFAIPFPLVHAQENPGPLTSDRPGLGKGSGITDTEALQVELGYAYNKRPDATSHEVGQLLLRYGVNDYLEIRGHVDSYVITEDDAGYAGPGFGAKAKLYEAASYRLSAMTTVYLPTGTSPFDSVHEPVQQALRLAFDGALSSRLTLSANGGASFQFSDDTQRRWFFIPTLTAHLTHRLGLYAGYARYSSDEPNENWAEAGLTYLLTPNTQLDANAGRLLDGQSDRFFIGIGAARRF